MKKVFMGLVLVVALSFTLVGCGMTDKQKEKLVVSTYEKEGIDAARDKAGELFTEREDELQAIKKVLKMEIDKLENNMGRSGGSASDVDEINSSSSSYSSLFDGLDFSNIKPIHDKINMKVVGEITNNNSVPVKGYFKLVFYDATGDIVEVRDSTPVPGTAIQPGATSTFSVLLHKFEYSTVSVEDSLVVEKK